MFYWMEKESSFFHLSILITKNRKRQLCYVKYLQLMHLGMKIHIWLSAICIRLAYGQRAEKYLQVEHPET